MEYFLVFVAGMAAALMILRWAINRAINRMLNRMAQEDDADPVTADAVNMELRVEFDNNVYFCYNNSTMAFVCQGTDLKEILEKFNATWPGRDIKLISDDAELIADLSRQKEKILDLS
jgi:hypothetical protein